MSDLLRQSVNNTNHTNNNNHNNYTYNNNNHDTCDTITRPSPIPLSSLSIAEEGEDEDGDEDGDEYGDEDEDEDGDGDGDEDEHHSEQGGRSFGSDSSDASVKTVRREEVVPTHWSNYFEQQLYFDCNDDDDDNNHPTARYHVYVTPPTDIRQGPLFICHHGAGSSALSFALFAREIRTLLPHAGILSLSARAHGSTVTDPSTGEEVLDFTLTTLTADAATIITQTQQTLDWPHLPPCILIGHSLGGCIVTQLASDRTLGKSLVGYVVIDFVEGYALDSLTHIASYLSTRPSSFASRQEAIDWHIRTRTIRNRESAEISVPAMLAPSPNENGGEPTLVWQTSPTQTQPFWPSWFEGQSTKFLSARGAKLLILAGTDRLDRELMIGQMQGKFQLVVVPESGHFVQEDCPAKVAGVVGEFWGRNMGGLVLPPKVGQRGTGKMGVSS
ncbi:hypothetical protein LTR62_004267 [Meristemomyces frigidus]|uniref:Protein phosphatase methylesterase 1 n=1 Tax=Meristemomyces frigidus TaxID=1508187 RepID=A0AAN7YGE8_9PEZI|nr:hypothetical protein LTR62_004267 [Meristemomyces frigidus]